MHWLIILRLKSSVCISSDSYASVEVAYAVRPHAHLQTNRDGRSQHSGRTVPDDDAESRAARVPVVALRGAQVPAASRTRVHLLGPHFLGYLVKQYSIIILEYVWRSLSPLYSTQYRLIHK